MPRVGGRRRPVPRVVRRATGIGGPGQPGALSADRDFVSYWTAFASEADDPSAAAWWVRRSAAAFRDGTGVVALWQETAPAAVRAAGRADPDGYIATQGHVLAVTDFLATLVTEAVIHHLDMTRPPSDGAEPGPARCRVGHSNPWTGCSDPACPGPHEWTAEEYLLKGTGRVPLSPRDRGALAEAAERFPLLG